MTIQAIENTLKGRLRELRTFNHTARLDFAADGKLFLDATKTPPILSRDAALPVEVTIKISAADFKRILDGTLNPTLAYASRKLRIEGSMGLALKLSSLLEQE